MPSLSELLKQPRSILDTWRLPRKLQPSLSKDPEQLTTFACVYYGDHSLVVASFESDGLRIRSGESVSIPVPSHVADDSTIHKQNDLNDILSDLLHLLNLEGCPTILLLSTSLFTFSSFKNQSNIQLTLDDASIAAASPYLPHETLVSDSIYVSGKDFHHSVSYASRKLIDGWFSVLCSCDCRPALICPAVANSLETLLGSSSHSTSILCDIELSKMSLFFCSTKGASIAKRLPYGTTLYLPATSDDQALASEFFERLIESTNEFTAEINEPAPAEILVSGVGFDRLSPFISALPYGVKDFTIQPVIVSRLQGLKVPNSSSTLSPSLNFYFSASILQLYQS